MQNIQSLFDFKELTTKKTGTQGRKLDQQPSGSTENEDILRSFKELRQKLKVSQRENVNLSEEVKILRIRQKQAEEALTIAMSNTIKLKDQISRDEETSSELKKRLYQMKEQLIKYQSMEQELQFTKQVLLEIRVRQKALLEENKTKTQIFLQEKMELEQQISKLKARAKSDEEFIGRLESQSSKYNQTNIKLQNKMRKMSISYDQDNFNQKWSRQNFQTEHLKETIAQMQKEIQSLKNKIEIQKEKRFNLQDQLIQLEESAGMNNVKAKTFSGETEMHIKKQQKLMKKIENLKDKVVKINEEKINLEETVGKYKLLCEETFHRLKSSSKDSPDIWEDLSHKFKSIFNDKSDIQSITYGNHNYVRQSSKIELQEKTQNNMAAVQTNHKRYLSNPQSEQVEKRYTFGIEKENQISDYSELEVKIRRERQEMEKKIKEKALKSKLECSMPNEMYQLRSEYISSFIDK